MKSDSSHDSLDVKPHGLDAYGSDPNAPASSVYVGSLGQVGIGTVTPASKLDVEGGGLTVNGGLTTLKSGLTVIGGSTTDNLHITAVTTTDGNMTVGGLTTANKGLKVSGGATINGGSTTDSLQITADTTANGNMTVGGLTTANKGLKVSGGATITGGSTTDTFTINNTNSGSFSVLPAPNKIPVADQSGHINVGWLPSSVPTGTIFTFAGTAIPSGFLKCDGSAVSRTTYATLFSAIGTTWGAGDGSTTFNLPNFQRTVAVGSGGNATSVLGNAVGNRGGAETHALTANENGPHTHGYTTLVSQKHQSGSDTLCWTGTQTVQTESSGSGTPHNIMQSSAIVNMVIKY